jgi:hypothetical protein
MTHPTTTPTETHRVRRGHPFFPSADADLPPLYATEAIPAADKIVRVHYFIGGCDWWLIEYDPCDGTAFGYACLGDPGCAEWGYVHLAELEEVSVDGGRQLVERDLDWTPLPVSELDLPGPGGR